MTGVYVPATALLSAVVIFVGRGTRARNLIARDLTIAERLPSGTAKQFLLDFAQEQTVRYVAREKVRARFPLTVAFFAVGAVCASMLAAILVSWLGYGPFSVAVSAAMGVLVGALASALAEWPSLRKKQGKHTEQSVVRLSLTPSVPTQGGRPDDRSEPVSPDPARRPVPQVTDVAEVERLRLVARG